MKQEQINRLEMMQATDAFLDANTAIWNPIPIIASYKTGLSQIIESIRSSAEDQEAAQVFIGSSLQQLKLRLAEKMDILDDALEAYADDTDNADLLSRSSNSRSDYLRLPHEDFETKTRNMIDLLESNVADMSDYGFTQDQIDDVKLSLNLFQNRRGKPRSYQIASRVATTDIEELMREATVVLDKIDRVMKRFKRTNSIFYNGYLAARTIINS